MEMPKPTPISKLIMFSEPIPDPIPEQIPIPEPIPESVPETDSEPTIRNRFQKTSELTLELIPTKTSFFPSLDCTLLPPPHGKRERERGVMFSIPPNRSKPIRHSPFGWHREGK